MRKAERHKSGTAPPWGGGLARDDLEGLLGAVNRLSGLADPSVIATNAAREARILAGVDLVGVAAAESDGSLAMIGSAGAASDWFVRLRFHIDPGEGFAGTALATRLPLVFDTNDKRQRIFAYDARDGASTNVVLGPPYSAHLRERIAPEELHEFIGVPIDFNGQALGLLYAGNRNGRPTSPRSRMLLARFAAMIGPLLSAARRAREAAVAELARERERIAFSLHDTIGQILFGIGSSAKRTLYLLPEEAADARQELRRIELETARAAAHLREAVRTLASIPAKDALVNEARILASMFTGRTHIAADVVVSGNPRPLPDDVVAALVSVVREGLNNVEKHAGATTAVVTVHFDLRAVAVILQDDGRGVPADFVIDGRLAPGPMMGLASLRRRIERVGGTLSLGSIEGGGAMLRAVV